jgi:hypothetical protein
MSTKAHNKRMHFIAIAANAGHDCTKANDWYCSLTRRGRAGAENATLLARFTEETQVVSTAGSDKAGVR